MDLKLKLWCAFSFIIDISHSYDIVIHVDYTEMLFFCFQIIPRNTIDVYIVRKELMPLILNEYFSIFDIYHINPNIGAKALHN